MTKLHNPNHSCGSHQAQRIAELELEFDEAKKRWYDKGWNASVREFEWRLRFLFEKDERWWRILEIIEHLKK